MRLYFRLRRGLLEVCILTKGLFIFACVISTLSGTRFGYLLCFSPILIGTPVYSVLRLMRRLDQLE